MNSISPFCFPAILLGDRLTTRKAWRRALTGALRQGNWEVDELSPSRCVTIGDPPAPILLEDDNEPSPTPAWYLGWIGHSLTFGPPHRQELSRALTLEGMKHLWFTVGLLGHSLTHGPLPVERYRSYYIDLLRGIVHWIPEIITLEDFFRDSTPGAMSLPSTEGAFLWQTHVYVLATNAFPECFQDDLERWEYHYIGASLSEQYRKGFMHWSKRQLGIDFPPTDLVESLIHRGIIEQNETHFTLAAN